MSVSARRVAAVHSQFSRPSRTHPAIAWRNYLSAIAERNVEDVFAAMTVEYARQLRALRATREFGPLFDLWCASQPKLIHVTACFVQGNTATLEGRDGSNVCRIRMHHVDGAWRVAEEEFACNQPR